MSSHNPTYGTNKALRTGLPGSLDNASAAKFHVLGSTRSHSHTPRAWPPTFVALWSQSVAPLNT